MPLPVTASTTTSLCCYVYMNNINIRNKVSLILIFTCENIGITTDCTGVIDENLKKRENIFLQISNKTSTSW